MQAFSEASTSADYARELADFCSHRFEKMEVPKGTVLWMNGDDAKELYVVETGELVLVIPDQDDLKVVETLLPGTMVCIVACLLIYRSADFASVGNSC